MKELVQEELTEEAAWGRFFADSASKREEASELYKDHGLYRDKLYDDTIGQDGGLTEEDKLFLKEFPKMKTELEECIQSLHAAADQVDKTHKKFAITNVVADSTSIVSSVMTILGLAVAPVMAGGGLILSAFGLGLGAAAAITSLSSSAIEHASNSAARERANNHTRTKGQVAVVALCKEAPRVAFAVHKCVSRCNQVMKGINKNVRAYRLAKANPRLTTTAKKLMTTGSLSTRSAQKVQKIFGGTTLAMTKAARMTSAVTAGAFILMDVATFIQDLNHLLKGAKAEMAEELREQAQELEGKLEELCQAYNSLLDIMDSHNQEEEEAEGDVPRSAQ